MKIALILTFSAFNIYSDNKSDNCVIFMKITPNVTLTLTCNFLNFILNIALFKWKLQCKISTRSDNCTTLINKIAVLIDTIANWHSNCYYTIFWQLSVPAMHIILLGMSISPRFDVRKVNAHGISYDFKYFESAVVRVGKYILCNCTHLFTSVQKTHLLPNLLNSECVN